MRLRHVCILTVLVGALVALPAVPSLAQKPGQTFQSPLKNFTVPVPKLGLGGTQVRKKNSKDQGTVSFVGDTGDSRRIDYMRLPPGTPTLTAEEQQAGNARMLTGLVEANANSVIAVQKPYLLDDIQMLLAVVSFPGGSHLMNQATGKHLDSTRGLLFFVRGGFIYVLFDDIVDTMFDLGKELPSVEELTKRAERSVPEFYRSITFK
jgi:hypothetical protein